MFWEELALYLDTNSVQDERRHGAELHRAQKTESIEVMKKIIIKALMSKYDELPLIPSNEWIRLQFLPNNPWSVIGRNFRCRFNMVMGLQVRLIQKHHPDQKYGAVLFIYFKEFSVRFRKYVSMYYLDDKCSIPIGHPDAPASAVRRQRKAYGAGMSNASDHDHIPLHITPSVINRFGTPPRRVEDSFFGGEISVTLKCAVFEPSTAKRHMTELSGTYPDDISPIYMIYTDGGGDHRTPFISVQVSYIALFLNKDLDMLIAARTPPGYSVLNPIERLHSTLNLGLNGTSLARKEMDHDTEKKIKSFSSKSDWRKAQERFEKGEKNTINYKKVIVETTKDVHSLINKKFLYLQYKGETIQEGVNASEEVLESFYDSINS